LANSTRQIAVSLIRSIPDLGRSVLIAKIGDNVRAGQSVLAIAA
jgi:hypothetical protein